MTPIKNRFVTRLRAKDLPEATKRQYVHEIALLSRSFNQSPDRIQPEQVRGYLVECARQMIADKLAAFKFFYAETLGWVWDNRMMMPRPPVPWSLECPIRRRMNEDMRLRNLAHKTRTEYDRSRTLVRRFLGFLPEGLRMYDRFLVPLDGSKLAEKAAAHAAELARQCSAELVLLRVCAEKKSLRQAVDYLDRVGEEARREHLKVRCEAYVGEACERIVRAAKDDEVDLIIMSSHGRTGIARTIFGSVAETVMRNAPCPVMIVRGVARPQYEGAEEVA